MDHTERDTIMEVLIIGIGRGTGDTIVTILIEMATHTIDMEDLCIMEGMEAPTVVRDTIEDTALTETMRTMVATNMIAMAGDSKTVAMAIGDVLTVNSPMIHDIGTIIIVMVHIEEDTTAVTLMTLTEHTVQTLMGMVSSDSPMMSMGDFMTLTDVATVNHKLRDQAPIIEGDTIAIDLQGCLMGEIRDHSPGPLAESHSKKLAQ